MQVETEDEKQGRAEQISLPLEPHDPLTLREQLDLVTPAEFAAALGYSEQTLAIWRCEGDGPPYVKLGRNVFYRRATIREWIAKRELQPSPAKAA